MKTFIMLIISATVFMVWASTCEAEDWVKYFSNRAGYEFFVEKDTLIHLKEGEVQVWYKSTPAKGETGAWEEWSELRLVDCTRRRYKLLQGTVMYKDKMEEIPEESTWTYLEPGALYKSFFNAVCGPLK